MLKSSYRPFFLSIDVYKEKICNLARIGVILNLRQSEPLNGTEILRHRHVGIPCCMYYFVQLSMSHNYNAIQLSDKMELW
jgi:hypothetical protein